MSRKALGRGLSALFTQPNSIENDLLEVAIDLIEPTEDQPRHVFNEERLEELSQSIRTNGLIQPIVVRRHGERYQIIAGERRWRAAQRAGLQKISCIVRDIPDERILELSLIENIQREELNPIEEAAAYRRLIDQLEVTQEELAKRVGKDRSSIANSLRLLKLPPEIQKLVEEERLTMGHARALLALNSLEKQWEVAQEVVEKEWSVRETERSVKRYLTDPQGELGRKSTTQSQTEDPNVLAAENRLCQRLSAPVKIRLSSEGGTIEIKFTSKEELMRLYDLLIQREAAI